MSNRPQRRDSNNTNELSNESLNFDEWQQLLADDAAPHALSFTTHDQPLPPPPPHYDPHYEGAASSTPSIQELFVDPSLLTASDLATYNASSQLPPLSWADQTRLPNESYVSMLMMPAPPPPPPHQEPPRQINAPAPRRSARIAAAPRVEGDHEDVDAEESQSSSVSVTDDQTSDDDSENEALPKDKKERRRAQVRKASRRRRAKLKSEAEFVATRCREQQEHLEILDRMYPPP